MNTAHTSKKESGLPDMIRPELPLIDLHRHLDGAVRLETILDLGRMHNIPLPAWDVEGLRPAVQITENQPGVMAFLEKFRWLTEVMVDEKACYRIARENVADAAQEGIDYIELRFSPAFMAQTHNLDPQGVVGAVVAGVQDASRETGVEARLIGIISRTYGVEAGWREFEALYVHRDSITALDLAGDEVNWPASLFTEHFRRGREAGWHITVHAGESAGPESVWQALRDLHAERIGHGIFSINDPALMEYLGEHRIPLEMNLTSNVQTSCVADYASHPCKKFLEQGLLVTINTDDPGISGIDLRYEFEQAARMAGISCEQAALLQRNALSAAFLSERQKAELLAKRAAA